MKRFFIIAVLALLSIVSANAQYVRYKDIKKDYNRKEYLPQASDPYSVGWSKVMSFFVPGSSQFVMHEPVKGVCFLGGNLICSAILNSEFQNIMELAVIDDSGTVTGFSDESAAQTHVAILGATLIAGLGISIWSCIDAGNVAKTKNMYYRDLYGRKSALEMNVAPSFALTPVQGGSLQPAAGMSFSINF